MPDIKITELLLVRDNVKEHYERIVSVKIGKATYHVKVSRDKDIVSWRLLNQHQDGHFIFCGDNKEYTVSSVATRLKHLHDICFYVVPDLIKGAAK